MADTVTETAPDPAVDGSAASAQPDPAATAEPRDVIPGRFAIAAWLALMGTGCVVVGGHDTFAAGDVPARLVGTVVLAAGIFFVVAAAALVADWREDRLLASMALGWAFLLGILILLSQLTNGEPSATLVIWSGMMAGSAAAFLALRRSSTATERQRFLKALPAAGSVVSIGVVISLAQFYYTSIYLPAASPPGLNVAIKLERAGQRGGRMVLHGEVTVSNISKTRATVLTSDVSALGIKGDATPYSFFATGLRDVAQAGGTMAAQRYWGLTAEPRLLYLDRVFKEQATYLDPDSSWTEPITIWVPAHKFDYVYVQADIFIVRGTVALDWSRTTQHRPRAQKGTVVDVTTTTPISERGWVRDLIRAPRSISTRWTLDKTGYGGVTVRFSPDDERLSKSYGYAKSSGTYELPLWKGGS